MSLSINNNITALNAWRNLKSTDSKMSSAMEKLSSGLRINRAADDPAGLVISEKMRAQLAGINAAINNSEKAINMVQTAEAALDKVQSLLDKMRQLALDSANTGVNDSDSLKANQDELDAAIDSITRIANYTQFGTKKLLDGSLGTNFDVDTGDTLGGKVAAASFSGVTDSSKAGTVRMTVGTQASQATVAFTLTTNVVDAATDSLLNKDVTFQVNGQSFTFTAGKNLADVAASINGQSETTGVTAAYATSGTLTFTTEEYGSDKYVAFQNTGGSYLVSAADAYTDYGGDYVATATFADGTTSTFNQGKGLTLADASGNTIVLEDASVAAGATVYEIGSLDVNEAKFQVGANENQSVTLSIQSTKATKLGMAASYSDEDGNTASVTVFATLNDLRTGGAYTNGVFEEGSGDAMAQAIGVIDKAIDEISTVRGTLGAVQADNLQVQLDSLRVSYENLQASESTIRDTDMTSQMAQFTKYQIMMQAGTAMLAQANQQPNNILQLLR